MPVSNGRTSAEIKPKGGKLLRCTLTVEGGKILEAKYTGDFFMMPGEAIQQLEHMMAGCRTDTPSIRRALEGFFTKELVVVGVTPDDFVRVTAEAIGTQYA
jgi:hypothetical protein